MSWRDRDYSQETWTESSSVGSSFRWPPRTARILIIVHIAAFVLMHLIASGEGGAPLVAACALSAESAHPLGIILHPLATRGIITLAITIFIIWSLGGRIENQHGRGRMLKLYVAGNLLAGLACFAVARLRPALVGLELDYPVGALAAWGVTIYRSFAGEMTLMLGKPRRVSHLVGIGVAAAVGLMFALHGPGALGWLAALVVGGCAEPLLRNLPAMPTPQRSTRSRPRVRPSIPPPRQEPSSPQEADIDDILEKISRDGIDSLTPEDRKLLEAARRAKLDQPR